jgi:phospholipid/cholesterol/gamma-HCH transport system substrate-binding protein
MESEARYIRVGLATLALVALLAIGLLWLAGSTEQSAKKRFVVYFQKQSLEGLQINSNVRMQGVNVGKVVDYAIINGETRKVRVLLQIDARTPVLEGAKAIIGRHLVTGLAAIDLDNPHNGTPLERVPEGERYPVIPEGVPRLAKAVDTLEELGEASRDALARFNELLSDDNRQAFAGTLGNLRDLSGELKRAVPQVSTTLASVRANADRVGAFSDEARNSLRDANAQLGRFAAEAESTLGAARSTLLRMDGQMDSLAERLRLTADLGDQEIQATAQALRQAGDALQETSRALANPARVLYGPSKESLGPGEDRK